MEIHNRCINLDWLEVHCLEPFPLNADFFRERTNYGVTCRAYGTPQYSEMFTLFHDSEKKQPFLEIRRAPYSVKSAGGIFEDKSCHLRLSNRECYNPKFLLNFRGFIDKYGYKYIGISRVDVAMDVLQFDDGRDPGEFLRDYILEKYYKVHLARISPMGDEVTGGSFYAHGKDSMYKRVYNSIKWGSPKSNISIKLYNKTKEMDEVRDKFYIRDSWLAAGLISQQDYDDRARIRDLRYYIFSLTKHLPKEDKDKAAQMREQVKEYTSELKSLQSRLVKVWRVEVSMSGAVKGLIRADVDDTAPNGLPRMIQCNLSTFETKQRMLFFFLNITHKYFAFKIPTLTKRGTKQRKDRCPDYFPFSFDLLQTPYKPTELTAEEAPTRMDKIIINRLRDMLDNPPNELQDTAQEGIEQLCRYFQRNKRMKELDAATERYIHQNWLTIHEDEVYKCEEITEKERKLYELIDKFVTESECKENIIME